MVFWVRIYHHIDSSWESVEAIGLRETRPFDVSARRSSMATAAHSISDGAGRKYKPNSKEILDGRAPTQQYFLDEYAKQDWVAPWDLGKPQPCLVQAEQEGLLQGEVRVCS